MLSVLRLVLESFDELEESSEVDIVDGETELEEAVASDCALAISASSETTFASSASIVTVEDLDAIAFASAASSTLSWRSAAWTLVEEEVVEEMLEIADIGCSRGLTDSPIIDRPAGSVSASGRFRRFPHTWARSISSFNAVQIAPTMSLSN